MASTSLAARAITPTRRASFSAPSRSNFSSVQTASAARSTAAFSRSNSGPSQSAAPPAVSSFPAMPKP